MKVFLSWSGKRSHDIAEGLKEWLILLFPVLDIWISSQDIKAGDRWVRELAQRLENTDFGILCLTPDNVASAWLLYEAGALSKSLDTGRVIPYLVNLEYSHLPGPLTHFQAVQANRQGTQQLVRTISDVIPNNNRSEASIQKIFDLCWPELETQLALQPIAELGKGRPTVRFQRASGTIVAVNDCPINLSRREYVLYLFLATRSQKGASSFPSYKQAARDFESWFQAWEMQFSSDFGEVWQVAANQGGLCRKMSAAVTSIRRKIHQAGLKPLASDLLPQKGRLGIRVHLESDLSH